jgi:uncharacterized membrane protein
VIRARRGSDIPLTPATSSDQQIGVNGAIAVVVTRAVGSMPTLYAALVFMGGWMTLATWWGPLHRLDHYPFTFLLFLDNVVQLMLCLVILVGQRTIGATADRRAVQTYEHAEAIFDQVAELQEHLDRHDQALSRGISLLESSPHPWIERHRVQDPPQATDQAETRNDRIAARLTQRLGTMTAFYVAAGTQVAWVVLSRADSHWFDPYPYWFMSFLSTLAQLVFMIVIMVGQDVLGRAADRRSKQTFFDAEAILHECRRMEARLTAQDRIIDSLTGYVNVQVTERLAQAIHETYSAVYQVSAPQGQVPGDAPFLGPWSELPEEFKESNRAQAREIGERLAKIDCLVVPADDPAPAFAFDDDEVQLLARLEHERWMDKATAQGFRFGPARGERTRPDLVPWERLSDETRTRNLQSVRRIPVMLDHVGFQAMRIRADARDGPRESDFEAGEWETLQEAMKAAGLLVALAEGGVAARESLAQVRKLRETSVTHPQRFIRELATASALDADELPPATRYADYEGRALRAIGAATAIVASRAPAQLPGFRQVLAEIAAAVASANRESGIDVLGARRRRRSIAAAMAAVTRAAGLEDAERAG